MRIRLDPNTPVPPFEQIRAQLALHVAVGRLHAGERLPPIRALAEELDVSPNTIARAYRELINAGIAEAAGRRGTRITEAPPVAHDIVYQGELVADAANQFALVAHELDIATDEALEAIISALRSVKAQHRAATANHQSPAD